MTCALTSTSPVLKVRKLPSFTTLMPFSFMRPGMMRLPSDTELASFAS